MGPSSTAPTSRKSSKRWLWLTMILALALIGGMGVTLTFNWFVDPETQEIGTVQPADAVVLFAGRPDRLDTAIELMERGAAPNLVVPNGRTIDGAEGLCDEAPFEVFCPDTDPVSTQGEAQAIGRLAEERGWSRLIAVTSVYHVHRATFLLGRCHDGPVEAVTPSDEMEVEDRIGAIGHEWVGYLAAIILQPAC